MFMSIAQSLTISQPLFATNFPPPRKLMIRGTLREVGLAAILLREKDKTLYVIRHMSRSGVVAPAFFMYYWKN